MPQHTRLFSQASAPSPIRFSCVFLGTLATLALPACSGEGVRVSRPARALSISFDSSANTSHATLVLNGLSTVELDSLRRDIADSTPARFLRVSVVGHEDVAVAGKYNTNDSALVFTPTFAFDAGRAYAAHVDARALHPSRTDSAQTFVVALPASNRVPSNSVSRILPSSDTLPENLLRFYIEFATPMSHTGGLEHIKLLDESGKEIVHAFLPLDADFWNEDRTRYTAFLDPGRVKRGILPNEQMGRAILQGRRYSMVIDSTWMDANSLPLVSSFRRNFTVGAADESRIDLKAWKVLVPKAGTRDAVVVTFPEPLDFGLLRRAVGVQRDRGGSIPGMVDIQRNETEWRFSPAEPWEAGDYRIVVFSSLEDAAGNRINRPFEVDMFDRIDKDGAPERYFVPFKVAKP